MDSGTDFCFQLQGYQLFPLLTEMSLLPTDCTQKGY